MSVMSDQFAMDFATGVAFDVRPETIVGPDSIEFQALVTALDTSIDLQHGGIVDIYRFSLSVAKKKWSDGILTEQFPDGIPAQGEICKVRGIGRRIITIEESADGAGWIFTMGGPDES